MNSNDLSQGIEKSVASVTAHTLNIPQEQLELEAGVGDYPQWDSVGHLTLLHAIEDEFKIVLDMDDMLAIETLEDIVETVKTKVEAGAAT